MPRRNTSPALDEVVQRRLQFALRQQRGVTASSSCENSRPIAAATWATSRAGAKPVEPGQQRLLQRGWDRHGRQRTRESVVVALVPEQIGLEHGPRQLLDEQRHAVRLCDDLVEHRGRQRLAAAQPLDHGRTLPAAQTAEGQRGDMGVARPGRHELGPEGDEHEHWGALHPVDDEIQQLQRGRICPMHVLVQGQDRPVRREAEELIDQHLERPLLLPMRAHVQRRIAFVRRERQQRREQRGHRAHIIGRQRKQRLELVEPRCGGIVRGEASRPLQQADHRMKRAGLMVR